MKSDEPIIESESTSFIHPRIQARGRPGFPNRIKDIFLQNFNFFLSFSICSSNLNPSIIVLANDFYIIIIIILLLMSEELLGRSVTETCF